MLKQLKSLLRKFFTKTSIPVRTQSRAKVGDVDGFVTILTQSQLDKRTDFKIGESYRVGEMTVTLHKDKASMLKAIAAVDARRMAKELRLRERAIDIMLMKPDELLKLQVTEWLSKRKQVESKLTAIMGVFKGKRYHPPVEDNPSGLPKERFKQIMSKVEDKEKVS